VEEEPRRLDAPATARALGSKQQCSASQYEPVRVATVTETIYCIACARSRPVTEILDCDTGWILYRVGFGHVFVWCLAVYYVVDGGALSAE
jgi:hypothetical protein